MKLIDREAFKNDLRTMYEQARRAGECGGCVADTIQNILNLIDEQPDFKAPEQDAVINWLCMQAHANACEHGFYDAYRTARELLVKEGAPGTVVAYEDEHALARLALIGSEVGEAVATIQHGDRDSLGEELADIVIRVCDLCGSLGIQLGKEIMDKMAKNRDRPYMHGKKC